MSVGSPPAHRQEQSLPPGGDAHGRLGLRGLRLLPREPGAQPPSQRGTVPSPHSADPHRGNSSMRPLAHRCAPGSAPRPGRGNRGWPVGSAWSTACGSPGVSRDPLPHPWDPTFRPPGEVLGSSLRMRCNSWCSRWPPDRVRRVRRPRREADTDRTFERVFEFIIGQLFDLSSAIPRAPRRGSGDRRRWLHWLWTRHRIKFSCRH